MDVEAFTGDEIVRKIIEKAHEHGVKVVASNHDFFKTPSKEEIISRLIKMRDLGADIPKIAVMPQSKKDVLTLLSATEEMVPVRRQTYNHHVHGRKRAYKQAFRNKYLIGAYIRSCQKSFSARSDRRERAS